jgi:hypothetical protein
VTDAHVEVLLSDFYRAGDGNDASFKRVQVIVADHDLAPDIDGIQNVGARPDGASCRERRRSRPSACRHGDEDPR